METVQCVKGHTWDASGQDTVAVCPVCGCAPRAGASVSQSQAKNDDTIGDDSFVQPRPRDDTTQRLAKGADAGDDATFELDLTIERHGRSLDARAGETETTLGVDDAEEEPADHTIGFEGEATRRPGKEDQTIGVGEQPANEDHTLGLPRGATRQEAQGDQTLGVEEGGGP